MLSQHRNAGASRAPNAIPESRILDATHELVLAVGVRRLSMAEIARRAGVSRATLYRRWENVDSVVGALVTRELALLDAQLQAAPARDVRTQVVEAVIATVRGVRAHPLFRKIIEVDPEFLLPYLVRRRGTSTAAQLELLTAVLRRNDGTIGRGNKGAQARAVWLAAWSFTLTGPVLADETVSLAALDRELRRMLDRYLAP